MLVKQSKDVARHWVAAEAAKIAGFCGAFLAGSTALLPDEAELPAASDVDVMVVLADATPPAKPGKFRYRDVLLEITYLSRDLLQTPELVLGDYHLAGSLRTPTVIADPSGRLTELQAAVAKDFAKRRWVYRRCEHARSRILTGLQRLDSGGEPFHDQVTAWLFSTGVTTHILLVAGLRNPTVRLRYPAVRALLGEYGRSDFYERLIDLLDPARMSRQRAADHLAALAEVFDATKTVIKTPFFFASDLSEAARPIAIDGSQELIARGDQREALFWMVATYARCQKALYHDAPEELQTRLDGGFRELIGDLGIASHADLRQRGEQVRAFLPQIWEVAEAIVAANPDVQD